MGRYVVAADGGARFYRPCFSAAGVLLFTYPPARSPLSLAMVLNFHRDLWQNGLPCSTYHVPGGLA
jgi:hypothetical protein